MGAIRLAIVPSRSVGSWDRARLNEPTTASCSEGDGRGRLVCWSSRGTLRDTWEKLFTSVSDSDSCYTQGEKNCVEDGSGGVRTFVCRSPQNVSPSTAKRTAAFSPL